MKSLVPKEKTEGFRKLCDDLIKTEYGDINDS